MRRALLLAALVALAVLSAVAGTAGAAAGVLPDGAGKAVRTQTTLHSAGTGRQVINGGGLIYGTVAKGGSVAVLDVKGDAQIKVTPKKYTFTSDGQRYPATTKRGLVFSISGTHYRVVLRGNTVLNGVGLYGKANLTGNGTYSLNGAPVQPWAGALSLGTKQAARVRPPATPAP
jgi:hypothetical protein